jgi:hypothetical protein
LLIPPYESGESRCRAWHDLKVCQNVLLKNAFQAPPEILAVRVADEDSDQGIVRVIGRGFLVHISFSRSSQSFGFFKM